MSDTGQATPQSTATMRVLVTDSFDAVAADTLRESGFDVIHNPMLDADTLSVAVQDLQPQVIVVRSVEVGAAALEASRQLALVICAGSDAECVDLDAASRLGVMVSHCPGRNAAAVAELAFGLMLACDRRIPDQVADLRAQRAGQGSPPDAAGLAGRTLGIVGLGQVGQEIARRGLAFGMHVVAWSKNITEDRCDALGVDFCSNLVNLAKLADVVSVSVTGNEETRGLLGDKFFNALRPGAILVNTSGGNVCDESALLNAVRNRGVRAGLDIFDSATGARTATEAALAAEPGVYGTFRVGACTEQARLSIDSEVVRILRAWRTDGAVLHCVNVAEHTAASSLLLVRHENRPGVLARIFDVLGKASINVEQMDNQISASGSAAIARVFTATEPSVQVVSAVRACPHVLGVTVTSLRHAT
jgi:D-3-phosphoglycerate dehydrogenase